MERTNYMQTIMNETYPDIAIEAIKGGFDGAWQRVIAKRLFKDYNSKISEAEVIVDSLGGFNADNLRTAANMIIDSKIPDNVCN